MLAEDGVPGVLLGWQWYPLAGVIVSLVVAGLLSLRRPVGAPRSEAHVPTAKIPS